MNEAANVNRFPVARPADDSVNHDMAANISKYTKVVSLPYRSINTIPDHDGLIWAAAGGSRLTEGNTV
ncbi:MAG: hypothetical protein AB7G68_05815 [Nitrospiraceae bacterium]